MAAGAPRLAMLWPGPGQLVPLQENYPKQTGPAQGLIGPGRLDEPQLTGDRVSPMKLRAALPIVCTGATPVAVGEVRE
jgi:hypothetical protein